MTRIPTEIENVSKRDNISNSLRHPYYWLIIDTLHNVI